MDDYHGFIEIFTLITLLALSAMFSGAEVALFSIDKKKIKEIEKSRGLLNRYISELLSAPKRLLITILVGNTLVNVGASIIGVSIAIYYAELMNLNKELIIFIQILIVTILVLFFGEVTPKVVANKNPFLFAKIIVFPVYWFSVIVYPVTKFLTELIKSFTSGMKMSKSRTALHSDELHDLADFSAERGTIEEEEQELIHGLVSFKSISVREVMTPRVDIFYVTIDSSFDELMKIINDSGHSRIPLCDDDLDEITGIIYAKDLLPFLNDDNARKNLNLRKIARKVMFVPESKLISELLHEFQSKKMHIGIVVDEYGGTAGLVTLEDILEEIVGEIRDEYDKEENIYTKLDDKNYMVLGKMPIDDLNELLESDFSSEDDDYDTIGGFIFMEAGSIPEVNFTFVYNNYRFTVKEIENKRINRVHIEKIVEPDEN